MLQAKESKEEAGKARKARGEEMTNEIDQHIAWLKQYIGGMSESNWKDMRLRADRQLEELSAALSVTRPDRTSLLTTPQETKT